MLGNLLPPAARTSYFANALDHTEQSVRQGFVERDLAALAGLGLQVTELDLRDYFGKPTALAQHLTDTACVFGSGGNAFVLRRAMALSGFDTWLHTKVGSEVVYGGYSAAICVLSPSIAGYNLASDPSVNPYDDHPAMSKGLGLIDWAFAPHAGEAHGEGPLIAREVEAFKKQGIECRPLANGDSFVTELKVM